MAFLDNFEFVITFVLHYTLSFISIDYVLSEFEVRETWKNFFYSKKVEEDQFMFGTMQKPKTNEDFAFATKFSPRQYNLNFTLHIHF